MDVYDVAGYHLRGMVHGLSALGLPAELLMREAGIDRRALDDPEMRFAEAQLFGLWVHAERLYGKPEFGLALALNIPFGRLELVDYLVAACPDVGSGLECLARHARLCASGFYFKLAQGAHDAELGTTMVLEHRHGVELLPRSLVEYLWALLITRFRSICGAQIRPVLLLRALPAGPAALFREALGRSPELADTDALFVPHAQWQLSNPRRDPMLSRLLEAHASDVRARLPEEGFEATVRSAVVAALHLGDPSIQQVGARLGLSPRTLQRRMDAAGTTFQDLVDQVRRELALHYLSRTQLSLTEISDLLAYAEPSAFGRAFRRWTGHTPASFREQQRAARVSVS